MSEIDQAALGVADTATSRVDVCVIDDDPAQRALLRSRLLREGFSVVQADNGADGLRQIIRHRPHIVICDVLMPGLNGLAVCKEIRSDPSLDGTYIIMVTSLDCRDFKHRALLTGADDYLPKPFDLLELSARIRNGLRVSRLQERLRNAALTDGLTGLWNHTQFRNQLDIEFSRTRRYGGIVSLLMIDLDHFKAVNDTYGHEVGNDVLKCTASHLSRMVREIDIVARYGGEEFVIILPETDGKDAMRLAQRTCDMLMRNVRLSDFPHLTISASIGVATSTNPRVTSVNDLVNLVDNALYAAKRRGRNQVVGCDDLDAGFPEADVQVADVDKLRKQVVSLSMQAKDLCLQSIWALVQALEARDPFTARHSLNVRFYVERLAAMAGWSDALCAMTANAAMLHDLGKIGVPDRILLKTGTFTEDEAAVVRRVPLLTCKIIEPLRVFETETVIIRHIRERYDGAGFPDGLSGANVPIGSRLLAIAEAFDALTTDRAHRPHRPIDQALAKIRADAGRQFDPTMVELLERTVREQEEDWRAQIEKGRRHSDSTITRAAHNG